jgi:phospholipid/cholesterol/gamma-HCH transport system substrate-binding protein
MSKEFRLGAFIVLTLLIFAVAVFLIGDRELLFKSTYQVKAEFQNVRGLTDGADVRVGGIHKGTVKRIDLPNRPDGKVTVVMDLQKATRDIVKQDSVAKISSEGLLGDKYVEVSFGSLESAKLKGGETLQSEPALEMADLVKKTDQILDSAKDALENVKGAGSNLEAISAKINQGKGTVGAMVNDKTMYQEATAGATSFQENMEAMKHNFLLRGFYRKRGYDDSEELKKHEIAQMPAGTPAKTFVLDPTKVFEKPDTAKLKSPKVLTEVGKYLEENKFALAVVAASAGMKGDTEKERVLTEARSAVVRDYLASNFRFDDTRVKTIGLGKSEENDDKLEIRIYQ